MREGLLLTVFLALFATACDSAPSPLTEGEREAIALEVEETLGQLTEAMNAHDSERVLAFFRNSDDFLYLGCTDFILGWEAFSRLLGPYYPANPDVVFQQEVVRTQVLSPTVAVAALRGSSTDAEALFWTEVLVREEDGRWLIAHEHESWPGCSPPSAPHPFTSGSEMPGMGEMGDTTSTTEPMAGVE
jgi:uncharacterized protein (TIGR02246 family)